MALAEEVVPTRLRTRKYPAVGPRLARGPDRIDDPLVAGTPADVPCETLRDGIPVVGLAPFQKGERAHHDPGGAIAALDRAFLDERVGENLSLRRRDPVQGHDRTAGDLMRLLEAGKGGPTVHQHRAAAADPLRRAAILGRGDAALLPQHLEEVHPLVVGNGRLTAVEGERHVGL